VLINPNYKVELPINLYPQNFEEIMLDKRSWRYDGCFGDPMFWCHEAKEAN